MHVCMDVSMYVHICIYIYVYACTDVHVHIHTRTYTFRVQNSTYLSDMLLKHQIPHRAALKKSSPIHPSHDRARKKNTRNLNQLPKFCKPYVFVDRYV